MNSTLGEICRWCLVAYKRFGWRFGVPRSECVLGEKLQRVSLIFRVVEDRMCGCDERVLPNVQGGMATRVQRAGILDEVRRQSIIPGPSAQRHLLARTWLRISRP